MGYTTEFEGHAEISPPLNASEISYLQQFAETRRMDRENGPFFVGGEGFMGQADGPDNVFQHNAPHPSQPGLWCNWTVSEDGTKIHWDGSEKFYDSPEWMEYIIQNFLAPAGAATRGIKQSADERFKDFTFNHVVNGQIRAEGEEPGDLWLLDITGNVVTVKEGQITYV
jgi:hypothetical protein